MDGIEFKIQQKLISHWEAMRLCIERIKPSSSLDPEDGYSVFKHVYHEDNRFTDFDIGPVLVNLPERANDTGNNLYVGVQGKLRIDRQAFSRDGALRTLSFSTEAGYFRYKSATKALLHVYGAHYDFSDSETGHPVFHMQMCNFAEFRNLIERALDMQDLGFENAMDRILKTVRLPSAQMDAFSLFLQLIADHLLWRGSSDDDKEQFLKFAEKTKLMQGAASIIERLQHPPASVCYRAVHWYPEPNA